MAQAGKRIFAVRDRAVPALVVVFELAAVRAVPDLVFELLRHVFIRHRRVAAVVPGQLPVHRLVDARKLDHRVRVFQRAFVDGQVLVFDDQVGVDIGDEPETLALRAGPERGVERKAARFELAHGDAVFGAGQLRGEEFLLGHVARLHDGADEAVALGHAEFRGFRDAALLPFADGDAVHDDVDGVLERFLQLDLVLVEVFDLAVHAHADESFALDALQHLLVHPLLLADDRRQQRDLRAFAERHELFHDLIHALARDLAAADRTMGNTDAGIEKSQVIVYFGDRPDGGTGVLARRLLVDGDGGRQAVDGVHVGFVDLAQELPGVSRKALHVAPLTLRVDGVER